MKEISARQITDVVEKLCIDSNIYLNDDIRESLARARELEESESGKSILESLVKNAEIAAAEGMAICQDTGMAIVFVRIGQDVRITGGSLEKAINEGVRRGYREGYLRCSIVDDPIIRKNTGDNTPAVIHCEIVEGDELRIDVAPKGFGSENMSALKMLKPSDGVEGIRRFVVETVSNAGPNPCPPVIVGVGIGGSMEKCALLAKKALLREVGSRNRKKHLADLEKQLLEEINRLGIGPAGLGGRVTALGVMVEAWPTHIAGLPVAVNISCHATRHRSAVL
ncbi:MAG TPA: fumarate hydratase [Thermoclostridium sp.]|nr:fumarate hydratase [Thermoclostridium sp.]HPU45729.1 fumarate hydratase [Thermoclostridium sp.]